MCSIVPADRATDGALEIELTADDLLAVCKPQRPVPALPARPPCAAGSCEAQRASHPGTWKLSPKAPARIALRSSRVAQALGAALGAALIAALVYRPSPPTHIPRAAPQAVTAEARSSPAEPAAAPRRPTVHFANPFDRAEVFEFPPGTTLEEAREAVAEILVARARDRQLRHARFARTRPPPPKAG
jgi:hypothetical protein